MRMTLSLQNPQLVINEESVIILKLQFHLFIINTFPSTYIILLHPTFQHVFTTICHTYFVPKPKYYHTIHPECFCETLELVSTLPAVSLLLLLYLQVQEYLLKTFNRHFQQKLAFYFIEWETNFCNLTLTKLNSFRYIENLFY